MKYYSSLDGLRAICIIITLINHTPGNPGINGTVGVDIFFALSGYLITTILISERKLTGANCIGCFYIRRFFRIVPLYLLTIALYLPATWINYKVSGDPKGMVEWGNALLWLLSFNSEWRTPDAGKIFGHAWTLGIEEKYYLLWPIIFTFIAVSYKRLLILLPLIFIVLMLGPHNTRGYIAILAGSVGSLLIENEHTKARNLIIAIPTNVWIALMLGGYFFATWSENSYMNLLVSLPAVGFISALINKDVDFYKKVLSQPYLVWLGSLTYAIYLTHRLVGHVFEVAFKKINMEPSFLVHLSLVYVASVIVAYVLSKTIEQPCIKIGKELSNKLTKKRIN